MERSSLTRCLLGAIAQERAAWEALLAEVGEDRMLESGAMGDWTFQDMVAHLTGMHGWLLAQLEDAVRGQTPLPLAWQPDRDSEAWITAWLYDTRHDQPLSTILAESRAVYDRLTEAIARFPDPVLSDPHRFSCLQGQALDASILSGAIFAHWHEDHEPELRRWLATTNQDRPDRPAD
jgi:hypothetical protein